MFIDRYADLSLAYEAAFEWHLVGLAVVTAGIITMTALLISRRVNDARGIVNRSVWLAAGAVALGLAMWSSHYIAVLALRLPLAYSLNPVAMALSLIPAAVAGGLALYFGPRAVKSGYGPWWLGAVLGLGALATHFLGMAGIQLGAASLYSFAGFSLAVLAAAILPGSALKLAGVMKHRLPGGLAERLALSQPMGLAFTTIHLAALSSAYFFPDAAEAAAGSQFMARETLAWAFGLVSMSAALGLAVMVRLGWRLQLATLLEKSATHTRNLLDTSSEGIVTTDARGVIRSFNAAAERIFGHNAQNVTGQSFLRLLPPSVGEVNRLFKDNGRLDLPRIINREFEFTASRANGESFPARIRVAPVELDGRVEFVGIVCDLSERKKAEEESRKQQEKLEFLLSASPIIIYTRSTSGTQPVTYVSPNVQELFGYLPSDILSSTSFWTDRVHPEDMETYLAARKTVRDEGMADIAYRVRFPCGNYRWLSDRRLLIRSEPGNPGMVVGSWTDITDHKLAEDQLRMNEERLRISLEAANMATWDWVVGSGEVLWSDNMRDKLGLRTSAPTDFTTFISAVHPEDRQRVKAGFKGSLVRGVPFEEEYRVVWPDRSIHWLHSVGTLIDDDEGNPQHMVGILWDVTREKGLKLAPAPQHRDTA